MVYQFAISTHVPLGVATPFLPGAPAAGAASSSGCGTATRYMVPGLRVPSDATDVPLLPALKTCGENEAACYVIRCVALQD